MRALGLICLFVWLSSGSGRAEVSLKECEIDVRYAKHGFAITKDARGVPVFDQKTYRVQPMETVEEKVAGLCLENSHFRATFMPERGRLHSFVNKATGNEVLWINPLAIPIGANNDTRYWMVWGGVEHVLPNREHGTTHALRWEHEVLAEGEGKRSLRFHVVEPLTRLEHRVTYSASADSPWLQSEIAIHNPNDRAVRFSHWTTALLAPGGRGEVSAKTELIVPTERFIPDDRDFNEWMFPMVGPADRSELRWVGQWKDIGDLMTSGLEAPYYAVYCHEAGEGMIRTFDLKRSPGLNIWGWGHPPTAQRQKEYTGAPPNHGYIEVWNGTSKGFKDAALVSMAAGDTWSWQEGMRAVAALGAPREDIARLVGN